MTDQTNKSEKFIAYETAVAQLKAQRAELVQMRTVAKGQVTRFTNQKQSKAVIKMASDRVDDVQYEIELTDQELESLSVLLAQASLIDAEGSVSVEHVNLVDIDDVKQVVVPVVVVLPMHGEIKSEYTGTAAGSSLAVTPYLNMEKYAELIEIAFDITQLDDELVLERGLALLEEKLSPQVHDKLILDVKNGLRKPLKIMGKKVAVVPHIDSPGGSPSESYNLGMKLVRESNKSKVPFYTFTSNGANSGGYMIGCTGDKVFVTTPFTTCGCIGVVSGYTELTERGRNRSDIVERIVTSGDEKRSTMDDVYTETSPEDLARFKEELAYIHEGFKQHVSAMRGDKITDTKRAYSGKSFQVSEAIELGLIDGVGHYEEVLPQMFGDSILMYNLDVTDPSLKVDYEGMFEAQRKAAVPQKKAASAPGAVATLVDDPVLLKRFFAANIQCVKSTPEILLKK
tara:strand:- start:9074 stop:10441 length:1368 start_codon:yes stop_codon:yes gene_type:complete